MAHKNIIYFLKRLDISFVAGYNEFNIYLVYLIHAFSKSLSMYNDSGNVCFFYHINII